MNHCIPAERGLDLEPRRSIRPRARLRLWGGVFAVGLATAAASAAASDPATTSLAVGLVLSTLGLVGLDRGRATARFRLRRRAVRAAHYEAWRAWDAERERWCLLVCPRSPRTPDAVTALADARRALALGPAYHAERGPAGPYWVFET